MNHHLQDKYVYAMDIGGTHVRVALISLQQGRIFDFCYLPYQEKQVLSEVLDIYIDQLEKLPIRCEISQKDVIGIGVSFPGLIDRNTGSVVTWPNRPMWEGFRLAEYLENKLQLTVVIEEDANAIAFGEVKYGQYETDSLLSVVIGTGIGSGLIINGELFSGLGWSGEIGHTRIIPKGGPVCVCGQEGCLQALASGEAILNAAREKVKASEMSVHLESGYDVSYLAYNGSEWATEIFEKSADWLALGIANVIRMYDVKKIILGGGVMEAGELIYEPFIKSLHSYLEGWPRVKEIQVEISSLGAQAGIFGAAAIIINHLEREYKHGEFENIGWKRV
ncbi:ROK family protein [Bacillus cereus]|uniref:ROK family protein n=1 Tax=Bacillus cereus TaxID=1396 RepID=UPI00065B9EA8|nr:ROK family protein [Bacillus cereus]KMQ32169.1 hypothetical protein TU58_01395 [Bacillus cereus]